MSKINEKQHYHIYLEMWKYQKSGQKIWEYGLWKARLGMRGRSTEEAAQRKLGWMATFVGYRAGGYTRRRICKNLQNCTPPRVDLTACKFF